jgi:phosphomannomutase
MVKFSVSGLRGVYGEELKIDYLVETSQAFTRFMGVNRLLLAMDARGSSAEIHEAVKLGLIGSGVKVLDAGMVTTPTAVYATRASDADVGIVITASHNPPDHNGLKFIEKARFLVPERIEEFKDYVSRPGSCQVSPTRRGDAEEVKALLLHLDGIKSQINGSGRGSRLRVGLDPVNGAAGPGARMLLEELGCEVYAVNEEPAGLFGRGAEPLAENLGELKALVREKRLDLGFAFDPDGDRLAFVDEEARIPGEEYTVPLCTQWALEEEAGDVVVNLSTSRLIEHVAERFGVSVHRAPVGEAYVVDKLLGIEGRCGGEGNGGFILPSFNATRDGLLAMAILVQLRRKHGSLRDLVDSLPCYHRHRQKFWIEWSGEIADRVSSLFPSAHKDTQDGLWLSEQDFWLHLRPSNTEPVVRLALEADTSERADKIFDKVRSVCVG